METTKLRRIDGVVFTRRPGRTSGGLTEEEANVRYAMAWVVGVPGMLLVLWMLGSAR